MATAAFGEIVFSTLANAYIHSGCGMNIGRAGLSNQSASECTIPETVEFERWNFWRPQFKRNFFRERDWLISVGKTRREELKQVLQRNAQFQSDVGFIKELNKTANSLLSAQCGQTSGCQRGSSRR